MPLKKIIHLYTEQSLSIYSFYKSIFLVDRGYSDDVTEKAKVVQGKDLLTEFQQDKFRYFFYHVLDLNSDHVISKEDFIKLNKRIKHYMDWSVNTIQFLALQVLLQNYYLYSTHNTWILMV